MFEQELADKFKKIFEVGKVTYDLPAVDTKEQEILFIEITESKPSIRDGNATAQVKGKGHMFAESGKLPFGFFPKGIAKHPTDSRDLFFYDFEENTRLYENIVERAFSFVYFFNSQYDPALGTLTSVNFDAETQ